MGSIWDDGVKVSRLCINEIKLLGLQDGLFLCLGTFGGDVLGYRWQVVFEKLVYEDLIIKLDHTQAMTSPPLMDVVGDVGRSVLEAR